MSVYEKLEKFVEDSGQSRTTAMERALTMYMDEYYDERKKLNSIK